MSTRKTLFVILIGAAPLMTGLVLVWLFSLEGTLGMYQWVAPFQYLLIAVGVLGVIAPLLALVARKRRVLAVVFAILGILVPLAIGGVYLRGSRQFAAITPPLLLITDGVGANSVPNLALVFRTAQETRNTLSYGDQTLDQQFVEPTAARQHVLPLNNLKPGVHYQWRLNDGATCAFTTPAGVSSSDTLYHFGAGGDPHLSGSSGATPGGDATILPSVLTYVSQPGNPFNTFFLLGDFVNMGSADKDWQFALNLAAPFTCSVPLRPVMGNHDTFINGAPQYLAYMYPQGMELKTGSRLYYRIDSGRVHFIMLKMLWGAESFTLEQRDWFIKQMESIPPDDWKIVMMHSIVYSSGSKIGGKQYYDPVEMVQQVAPLLEKYKVDLAISGHAHHLEFLQKNGVSYAVVGGLGAPLDEPASNNSVASLWYLFQQHGFLDVTVHPATIELHFRDPNGNELKSFSISKNK